MPTLSLYRWRVTDPESGRTYTTRHLMTEADARATDPKAVPVLASRELRKVPDDPTMLQAGQTRQGPQTKCRS